MNYHDFFLAATGGREPFRFQERFREEHGNLVVLSAPTGLGKTDTALISFLHRLATRPGNPKRLAWCLHGRALTEQIADVAEGHIGRLVAAGMLQAVPVYRLLGGSADNDLRVMPDEPAVLVGTQDLLLSRALNRGYARNPFRWPFDFALLNNDCEWVFDEVQLLGDGLATSTQLAAFREQFGCFGRAPTCWMSATFDRRWLETVDFAPLGKDVRIIAPDEEELEGDGLVRKRFHAQKRIQEAPVECRMPRGAADFVLQRHRPGTLSLVIANTVPRAVEVYRAVAEESKAETILLHSRFRAHERMTHVGRLKETIPPEGRIVISTQVIEAGIDLDAALLITDLAPYTSLVQRFGRVNRYGEQERGGEIYWVDRPLVSKQKDWASASDLKTADLKRLRLPYSVEESQDALLTISKLKSASPADLPTVASLPPWEHVLRRADMLDLFDTSADLGGNQIDIARFVRSGEDRDVYVAWRDWPQGENGGAPPSNAAEIDDAELCPVPGYDVSSQDVWHWNPLTAEWERPQTIYPGMVLLLHASQGKYTDELGWAPQSRTPVLPLALKAAEIEAMTDERRSFAGYRQLLTDHTEDVLREVRELLDTLDNIAVEGHRLSLETAARKHDWGKAHPVMQQTLHGTPGEYAGTEILAKQVGGRKHSRRYFRHELGSALAMLSEGDDDLAAYIVAAHHGRVRVCVRSMPGEREGGRDFIRGIGKGDALLPCSLGHGEERAAIPLSLEAVLLGRASDGRNSWTDRALRLRDWLGPFRLAYLEMLLRAADERASAKAGKEAQ